MSVDPGTDFWRETGYGYIRDSGHVYGEVLTGDLDVSVRLRAVLEAQYDQAGVMIRADEQTWIKTGVEYFEGRPRLSTVLTLGKSSWMVTDLPEGTDEIVLKVSRRGDAVEVRYLIGEGTPELAALVYIPPGKQVLAGVMCAAPEGPGFRVWFHDLQVTEPGWSGPAEEAGSWSGGGETAWAGGEGEQRDWTGDSGSGAEPGWTGETGAGPAWPGETGADAGWASQDRTDTDWTGEGGTGRTWAAEEHAPAVEPVQGWTDEDRAKAWDGEPATSERPDRPERSERPELPDLPDLPERSDPPERPERPSRPVDTGDDPIWQRDKDDDPDWARELARAVEDTDWPGSGRHDDKPGRPEDGGSAGDGPGQADGPAGPGGSGRPGGSAKPEGSGGAEGPDEPAGPGEPAGSGEPQGAGKPADSGGPDGNGTADISGGPGAGGRGEQGRGEPGRGEPATAESGGRVRSALARLGLTTQESAGQEGTEPGGAERGRPASPEDLGRRDSDFQAWTPAPTLGSQSWFEPTVADTSSGSAPGAWSRPDDPDAAADWDRLAAGVQAARTRFGAVAERWTAQTDVDVANEWPGPPLRAARQAAILNGWNTEPPAPPTEARSGRETPGQASTAQASTAQASTAQASTAQASTAQASTGPERQAAADPAGTAVTAEAESAGGQADLADQDKPGAGRRPVRPPLDLPAPPDPADEWISLLTADPAEE